MDWLLSRLWGRNQSRVPLVCYLRENGPIAYGTDVFGADPRARAEAMLATGLTWYWKSSSRVWTDLTRWSLAALLTDLSAEPGTSAARVLVVGVDDSARETHEEMTDARVAAWMRGFGAAANGPLHAVVSRPGPAGDLLFVAQQPPESIRAMLQAWGVNRDRAERKSYARLHGHGLEDLLRRLG